MDILRDKELRCRPIKLPEDISIAIPWYHDEEVLYYSEGEGTTPYNEQVVDRMYTYLTKIGEVYIIEIEIHNKWVPIGDVTLSKDMLPIVIGDKDYRSSGMGKRVMHLMVERAKALGWNKMRVNKIYHYNERSRRLFESLGFSKIDTGMDDHGREYDRFELKL